MVVLLFLAACGPGDETPTPPPVPTPPPTEILHRSAEALLGLQTLAFTLSNESGNIPLMTGVVANEISGVISMPDEVSVTIKGEVDVFRAYLELSVVRTEGIYYLTDPLTGDWRIVDQSAVPFDLTNVGINIGTIMKTMTDTNYVDNGSEGDAWRITGKVLSQDLGGIIFGAAEGYAVDLEVWIRNVDSIGYLPEKARIAGRVVETDTENYVRILTLGGFNEPVNIEKPPI
jgi:hypothetical protein